MAIRKAILILLTLGLYTLGIADEPKSESSEAKAQIVKKAEDKANYKATNSEPNNASETQNSDEESEPALQLLRLGSGTIGGNYFVLGELVGGVISHPSGSLDCEKGGTCGVPNLQSVNITTSGSLSNLTKLQKDEIDSGFSQSDIAYWAYTGTGAFANKEKHSDLRAIASLYPEAMHIVVRKGGKINSIADLVDKRVSVGARKSGTLNCSRLVLNAYGLSEDDMQTEYLNNQESIEKLNTGELDAMFFLVGTPAPALVELFNQSEDYKLLSIDDKALQKIFKEGHYFSPHTIAQNAYKNVEKTKTISVYALWLTKEKMDNNTVYLMTKALWGETAKQLLNSSDIGRQMSVKNSLNGIGIPLHEGAKKYYNEIGKRF